MMMRFHGNLGVGHVYSVASGGPSLSATEESRACDTDEDQLGRDLHEGDSDTLQLLVSARGSNESGGDSNSESESFDCEDGGDSEPTTDDEMDDEELLAMDDMYA
jgi:hypothetical protein